MTRLSGHGPALLVVPDGKTPFEAYNPICHPGAAAGVRPPIFTDPTPRGITFEGFYDWMVHSQAFAENEWKKAQPWNPPTMLTLAPASRKPMGSSSCSPTRFATSRRRSRPISRPVAVGIPGYVLPMDIDARLFLKYPRRVQVDRGGADGSAHDPRDGVRAAAGRLHAVNGKTWGRSRLTITYEDGSVQTIHYFVTKPEPQAVADMGHFLTTKQWFVDPKDPFHRSPSVMTYDREATRS